MIIGVAKETLPGERRVALVPGALGTLVKRGATIQIETGAGMAAGYPDREYVDKGAVLVPDRRTLFGQADVLAQVNTFGNNPEAGRGDLMLLRQGQVVIGLADPLGAPERVRELAQRGVTAFGLELMPRITRAQSMDVLSSMASIAGYKAVLIAAMELPRMFPMMMTAAGTLKPARVLVMGVGVAGLQAIATSRRLGAVVSAYDVRPAVKEQVQSLGARFVELGLDTKDAEDRGGYAKEQSDDFLRRQREAMTKVVAESDVVITTAAIPGRRSPVLVTADMVTAMAPGSVIVDLGAERGGNCELTQSGKTVVEHGVTIVGPLNLPSSVPYHASQMYAKNLATFLEHLVDKESKLVVDTADEITAGTLLCQSGEVVHSRLRELLGMPARSVPPAQATG
ncbi:MAG TPA: Re/Si-specific NAD(P)(+) transhydrogenase subunit alpha [Candidatus Acidoferrum sp.]|nr:Re/Si-specific NAD(P)(+) transhydrogenase subunit alpha [Candidatus Acidoferrum sp.]